MGDEDWYKPNIDLKVSKNDLVLLSDSLQTTIEEFNGTEPEDFAHLRYLEGMHEDFQKLIKKA